MKIEVSKLLLEYASEKGYEIYSADFSFHESKIEKAISLVRKPRFSMITPFNMTNKELCSYLTLHQRGLIGPLAGFKSGSIDVKEILAFLSKNFGSEAITEYTAKTIGEKYKIEINNLSTGIKIGEDQCPWVQAKAGLISIYLPFTAETLAKLEEYTYFIAGEGHYNLTGGEIANLKMERAMMLKKPKLQLFIQGREKNTTVKSILKRLSLKEEPFHLKYITNADGEEAIEVDDLSLSDDLDAEGYVVIETFETDLKKIRQAVTGIRDKGLEVKSIAELERSKDIKSSSLI